MAIESGGFNLPDIPAVQVELPTPDIPPTNFEAIGAQVASGAKKGGLWDDFLNLILEWIPKAVAKVLSALLTLLLYISGYLVAIILKAINDTPITTSELQAKAVSTIAGINVGGEVFKSLPGSGARENAYKQVTQALLDGLGGAAARSGPGGIVPSRENAERYLQSVISTTIDNWAEGMLVEVISLGAVDQWNQLKDNLNAALGIGSSSRAVLHPIISTFVTEPFEQYINQTYRPKRLSETQIVHQFVRGVITRDEYDAEMGVKGYTQARAEQILSSHIKHSSAGTLVQAAINRLIDEDTFYAEMAALGWDRERATIALNVTVAKQRSNIAFRVGQRVLGLYLRGKLDRAAVEPYATDKDLNDFQREYLTRLLAIRQAAAGRQLTLHEVAEMVRKGVVTISDYENHALALGYSQRDADNLTLLLLGAIASDAERIKAREDRDKARAEAEKARLERDKARAEAALAEVRVHGVSIARYEALVKDGVKSIVDYAAFLHDKGLTAENVNAFTAHLQNQLNAIAEKQSGAGGAAKQAAAAGLHVSQLEKAVKAGVISMAEYLDRLQRSGLAAEDVQILGEVLQHDIDLAKARADALAAAKAAAQVRGLTLAQEQLAVRQGLRPLADYRAYLVRVGYDAADVELLVHEMELQIAKDQAAEAARNAPAPIPPKKGLSVSQVEARVRAGLAPIGDYQDALQRAGYDDAAVAGLVGLLQLRIDQDARVKAIRGQASGAFGSQGLSLADIARAVRAKVLPIADYTAALRRVGVSEADAQTLTLTLAAGIKVETPKPAVVRSVAALVGDTGVSLSRLESEVLAGRMTLSAFGTVLAGAGVPAGDIAKVSGVLQLLLDQRAAARALVADAEARASAKQLSLAQEIAAVKWGVQGLPDYADLAAKLGYDEASVAILVNTLAAQLGAFAEV